MSLSTISSNSIRPNNPSDKEKMQFYQEDLEQVEDAIRKGKYTYSTHALERMKERNFTPKMIQTIIENGKHESAKDAWNSSKKSWKFRFCDQIEGRDIDVFVGLDGIPASAKIITTVDRIRYKTRHADFTCFPSLISHKFVEAKKCFNLTELDTPFDELLQKRIKKCQLPLLSGDKPTTLKKANLISNLVGPRKKRKLSASNLMTSDNFADNLLGRSTYKSQPIFPPYSKVKL